MFKHGSLFLFVFISVLLLAGTFSYADNTFVVISDVVFVRDDPKRVSPFENMSIRELDDYGRYEEFPRYFFYGENITGAVEKENPDAVKAKITIYEWEKDKRKERKVSAYIDRKKLWQEPPLTKVSINSYMTLTDTRVYIIPDLKYREVVSLYQGEVVKVVGQLKYGGISWIKAKFGSTDSGGRERESSEPFRYGYIKESELQPLETGKVDESKLTISEIPKTMRNSKLTFSDRDREHLSAVGFYIEPIPPDERIGVDDMVDLYHTVNSSIFITSDLYLHSFHLIFDRMLQDIERKKIFPEIRTLTKKLVEETKKEIKSNKESNDKIKKALLHNLFFFSVAAKLFDPGFVVPQEVRSNVSSIVKRIVKAEVPLPSFKNKIELGEEDFTQYRVRGHYQKKSYKKEVTGEVVTDDLLERYFRGMMWYGRHPFLLSDDTKTISAILIARTLENSGEIKRWEKINSVLTRLAGKIDDWSPKDYNRVSEKVYGTNMPKIEDVASEGKIRDFKEQAVKMLPAQKIVSVQTGTGFTQKERLEMTSGFKFLGQRFTADAYIFNQLTSPSVPRDLPTSLDVMSILGSKAAEETIAKEISAHGWVGVYKSQAEKLKMELINEIEKKETSYSNWLHSLTALYLPAKSKQFFAAKEPWLYKNLNTALGSWTELKHDTILYAEQSYAESGEGSSFDIPVYEPPYVKGYVEPNPDFFDRLLEMVSTIRLDLQKNKFIIGEYNDKLQTFEILVKRAYEIAKKEIEGSLIAREDYRWMLRMARSFDRKLLLPRDTDNIIDSDYLKMALIADVATDAVAGRVLEVAIGVPQKITVAAKDPYGGTRICTGYVYSWYEFADTKRWTDKEWKEFVYASDQTKVKKLRPLWYSKFLNQ
ncbi:MAG: DUF3160 domain-containing protein [Nitrospirae bacterium]|nr:DUF3160 domain-containing protein [Nitrospirota bacterium]